MYKIHMCVDTFTHKNLRKKIEAKFKNQFYHPQIFVYQIWTNP